MDNNQLIAGVSKRVGIIKICMAIAFLIGMILINTPIPQLGYWILGASTVYIGIMIGERRSIERNLVIAEIEELDTSEEIAIKATGIRIVADTKWIESDKNWNGYSRIKNSTIYFKYKEAQQAAPRNR